MNIPFMGTTVPVMRTACHLNGKPQGNFKRPYVNLYVRVTDACGAKCGFCNYHGPLDRQLFRPFNVGKFKKIFEETYKSFWVNKLAFTGGEPTQNVLVMDQIVSFVHRIDPGIPITVNTNGDRLKALLDREKFLAKIHDVALSMHHYTNKGNHKIFGSTAHATIEDIKEFSNKDKLHLRCNLIKGFIDCQDEVMKYIDRFTKMGITDFGFVSLMEINDYCRDNFVSYEAAGMTKLRGSMRTQWRERPGCNCENFILTTDKGVIIRFYSRINKNPKKCESSLVYDQDTLLDGFNGKVIL